MNSLEWEIFKRTGKIEHYLLVKEKELVVGPSNELVEFSNEWIEIIHENK